MPPSIPKLVTPTAQTKAVESGTPRVDGFKITGKLKTNLKNVGDTLTTLSFLQVSREKDAVEALYVESRDIKKSPYLFSIVRIKNDGVEILYSIPPEIAPRKRRIDVIRYLLNIASLIEQDYSIDNEVLYQLIENALKEMTESITLEYSKLYTTYDNLQKDAEYMRKKVERLTEENHVLASKNYELKIDNDQMRLRLGMLETLSDEALKARVQEWITEHNGEINISEFAKTHRVVETKVEEILNRLVSEGYLDLVQ